MLIAKEVISKENVAKKIAECKVVDNVFVADNCDMIIVVVDMDPVQMEYASTSIALELGKYAASYTVVPKHIPYWDTLSTSQCEEIITNSYAYGGGKYKLAYENSVIPVTGNELLELRENVLRSGLKLRKESAGVTYAYGDYKVEF